MYINWALEFLSYEGSGMLRYSSWAKISKEPYLDYQNHIEQNIPQGAQENGMQKQHMHYFRWFW